MRIDSLQYNGACTCGRSHTMQTELCVVERGCLKELHRYLKEYHITGKTVAVYDENTYRATADRHPTADYEVILDPTDLHANEHGVAYLDGQLPEDADVLIAVGSGTVHDITRYCAYTRKIDFVSCPTAASVDGFCSSVAAMTWHGCKKTLTAVAPRLVVADTEIFSCAPMRLTRSGFGDMIGKYIALTDWKIGHVLTDEFYCARIADMTLQATEAVLASVDGIADGSDEAYEKLMYGLLLSGLAMQMLTYSRPASGAEHHLSHLVEMSPPPLGVSSDALHGEKVGVGTLMALREYKRLREIDAPSFADYEAISDAEVITAFGKEMAKEIFSENAKDAASGLTAQRLEECWGDICTCLDALPDPSYLLAVYEKHQIKKSLCDMDVDEKKQDALLRYSPLVRNRLTLMRIRNCIS